MYGPDSRHPGSYAANCILARRLAERGVRFIQLFHRGWDQHNNLPREIRLQCMQTDQPSAALVMAAACVGPPNEFDCGVNTRANVVRPSLVTKPAFPVEL